MTDKKTPTNARDIQIEFLPAGGGIKIVCGNVTPDEMILAAHYIERTADQLLDAQQATHNATRKPALEIVHSIPDHRNGA